MAGLSGYICLVVLVTCCISRACNAQKVDACPCYACNPRGSFSYSLNYPNSSETAYVVWKSDFFIGPLPNSLGCVGNPNNIVCQSNGPKDVGYISLDVGTGKLYWADTLLRFPVLPVMDIFGDVIGTDGHYLVMYDDSGKLGHPITIDPSLFPLYSILVSENSMILLVSHSGAVIAYEPGKHGSWEGDIGERTFYFPAEFFIAFDITTKRFPSYHNGSPEAAIWLTGTVERSNGTFQPVATPIIHENRCYVLTEFKPDDGSLGPNHSSNLGLQRLYAIDMYQRMVDRLHITWYFNFERMSGSSIMGTKSNTLTQPTRRREFVVEMDMNEKKQNSKREPVKSSDEALQPSLMFNVETSTVMVNLPPPESNSNAAPTLWGLKDTGDTADLAFRVTSGLRQMAMYDTSTYRHPITLSQGKKQPKDNRVGFDPFPHRHTSYFEPGTAVWAVTSDKKSIVQLSPLTGAIQRTVNVSELLKVDTQITSDLMVSRSPGSADDHLIFGVETVTAYNERSKEFALLCKKHQLSTNSSTFVVGVSGVDSNLVWTVALPEGLKALGQIAGIPQENDMKDILVVFAGDDQTSKVLAISSR